MSLRGRWIAATVACLPLVAADWPGRERELAGQIDRAPAARRSEILTQIAATGSTEAASTIVHALEDPDPVVRMTAGSLVARYHYGAARPVLLAWLAEPLAETRAAGARGLGALGDAASIAPLVRMLGDADVSVRLASVDAIASIGGADATVPLLDRLADPESGVRVRTARALGALGDARAVLSLLGALQDSMPEVREATATALGRLRDPRAVRGLLGLLRDPQADVRLAATRALGTLGAPEAVVDLAPLALGSERSTDPSRAQMARAAVEAIGRIGGRDAVAVLVRAMRRPEAPSEVVHAAADALRSLGAPVREAIPDLAEEPIPAEARDAIVGLLGELGGERASTALIAMLSSTTPDAVAHPATLLAALGRTGTAAALRLLLVAAGPDDVPGLTPEARDLRREAALSGLRIYAEHLHAMDPESVDPLIAALEHPSVRGTSDQARAFVPWVAGMLGASHNPRASAVLMRLLRSTDASTRATAAEALGDLDLPTGMDLPGVEALAAALGDTDASVRLAASESLAARGGRTALDAILAQWNGARPIDRGNAARTLARIAARIGDARVAPLLDAALHTSGSETADAVLDALAWLAGAGDAAAATTLLEAVRDQARVAADEALANAIGAATLGTRARLLDGLRAMAQRSEPEARATAAWGFRHALDGGPAALLTLLGDGVAAVSTNAAGALARGFAAGVRPTDAARAAVCRVFSTRQAALLRANLLRAAANGGFSCDAETQRRLALEARTPVLRAAAAASLVAAARGAPDRRRVLRATVDQCARADSDGDTAAECRTVLTRFDADPADSSPSPSPPSSGSDTIDARVIAADESTVAARTTVAVVMADGIVRIAWTGRSGWVHERPAPTGTFTVLDPSGLAPEP